MFTGLVPVPVIQQLLEVVPFAEWGDVFCCCSGSFRVDGAIKRRFPLAQVHSNDVSLLSCGLGALLAGGGFSLRFHGRLEFVESHVDTFSDRVAAVLVCLEMAKYKAANDYAVAHFGEYRENFDKLLALAKATVARFTEGVHIDTFTTAGAGQNHGAFPVHRKSPGRRRLCRADSSGQQPKTCGNRQTL